MKLFALSVLYKGADNKVILLDSAQELQQFGYFQRSSIKEFMEFTSKIIVERTHIGQRSCVKEQEYMCHTFVRSDSLSGVLISDHEYPTRVSQTLLTKVLEEFANRYPPASWPGAAMGSLSYPELAAHLTKYQDPKQADAMTKLQADLDETKIILHGAIEGILERGEKLDDLVEKSEGLSMQSKAFYKTAKKTNQCCTIL